MDCPFCQQPTPRTDTLSPPESLASYTCQPCQAIIYCIVTEVRRIGSDKVVGWIPAKQWAKFRAIHKGQHYTVMINWRLESAYLEHNNLETKVDKQIARWDFIPNLTPQNIQDKLPTLLTFS